MTNLTIKNIKNAADIILNNETEISAPVETILPVVRNVITELKNPSYKWRSLDGLAEDLVMEVDDVALVVMALIDSDHVITKKNLNSAGRKMFNFKGHNPVTVISVAVVETDDTDNDIEQSYFENRQIAEDALAAADASDMYIAERGVEQTTEESPVLNVAGADE